VKQHARDAGFDIVGIAHIEVSEHAAFYRAWLERGYHGDMQYLAREDAVARRLDPAHAWPQLKSAIVVGMNYYTEDGDVADRDSDASRGIIARYARGRDYHRVIKRRLLDVLSRMEDDIGHELPAARAYVDTGPVLERELARRAGLGWFGRNTMLIDPKRGSYFFLATLLVEIELEADAPFAADHCGRCNACVDACPTGALLGRDANGAPVIDATRCISYLTIENRGAIPRELRPLVGNRVFGCDICQEVCPWNSPKFVQLTNERDFVPRVAAPPLIELMRMSYDEWDVFTRGSPMRRAGYVGFRRNVAVASGNWGSPEAVPVLVDALSDPEPLVRAHAAWALGRVGTAEARSALSARVSLETDACVLEELSAAMAT
jgi:epoxyqueuosine reductase